MTILVTGGAGYIGSHTCVELLKTGYEVIVVDNFVNSKPEALNRIKKITDKDFKFYEVDMLDRDKLEDVFKENKIDAVIHFAGLKAVGESVAKPLLYYHNNLVSTINLCEFMEKYGVYNIVFSSSATVYGIPETVPVREDFPLSTTNPYGATKLMIENILTDWAKTNDKITVALLRYFNPIGSHESGLIGEEPNGIPNNLMPYICRVASGLYDHVSVYGDDYDTVDGTGVRDYIHVVDLALGHLKALEWSDKNTGVEAFNLGTGEGYSVLQIIKAFEKATAKNIAYEITPRRPGDAPEVFADPAKAKDVLSWKATRGIEEMCRDSWHFVEKNPKGL